MKRILILVLFLLLFVGTVQAQTCLTDTQIETLNNVSDVAQTDSEILISIFDMLCWNQDNITETGERFDDYYMKNETYSKESIQIWQNLTDDYIHAKLDDVENVTEIAANVSQGYLSNYTDWFEERAEISAVLSSIMLAVNSTGVLEDVDIRVQELEDIVDSKLTSIRLDLTNYTTNDELNQRLAVYQQTQQASYDWLWYGVFGIVVLVILIYAVKPNVFKKITGPRYVRRPDRPEVSPIVPPSTSRHEIEEMRSQTSFKERVDQDRKQQKDMSLENLKLRRELEELAKGGKRGKKK